jgi:hypothetical protein
MKSGIPTRGGVPPVDHQLSLRGPADDASDFSGDTVVDPPALESKTQQAPLPRGEQATRNQGGILKSGMTGADQKYTGVWDLPGAPPQHFPTRISGKRHLCSAFPLRGSRPEV